MANGSGGSDFIVHVEGVKLDDAVRARLAGRIQAAVLKELAGIDTGGDLHARIPHRDWWGLWLRKELFAKDQINARITAQIATGGPR
ncbi:MAG: hypothetical protein HOQ11_01570 [Gemmatimonadaceae bacterium]|nr:hypothetical protein [Gemmatimonadaceae bacterium]NUQ93810.1 hypothetical protein [Gemmatimonadaceae bacterium]NUR19235.1 hypothetical protein [Gemmatimonadaceae bacterium]NUS96078.1 hypothetical protein [Gemmatimonadaceae bacterium]